MQDTKTTIPEGLSNYNTKLAELAALAKFKYEQLVRPPKSSTAQHQKALKMRHRRARAKAHSARKARRLNR